MKLSRDYIWEKLMASVSSIAEVDAPIKRRLANAYISQLIRLEDGPSMPLELPEDLAEELRAVLLRLRDTYQAGDRRDPIGDFSFDTEEAGEIISKIISIYDSVCRMMKPWDED